MPRVAIYFDTTTDSWQMQAIDNRIDFSDDPDVAVAEIPARTYQDYVRTVRRLTRFEEKLYRIWSKVKDDEFEEDIEEEGGVPRFE